MIHENRDSQAATPDDQMLQGVLPGPQGLRPMSRAILIYISMHWPRPSTFEMSVFPNDTVFAVLEKIQKREARLHQTGNQFANMNMSASFMLWYYDEFLCKFMLLEKNEELQKNAYLAQRFQPLVGTMMRERMPIVIYMTHRNLDDIFSDDDSFSRESNVANGIGGLLTLARPQIQTAAPQFGSVRPTQVVRPDLALSVQSQTNLSHANIISTNAAANIDMRQATTLAQAIPSGGISKPNIQINDANNNSNADILDIGRSGTQEGLSLSDTKCPVTKITFVQAMRCKNCVHRVDRDGLTIMLQYEWNKNKKKTASCPVYGCSGKWTERTAYFDVHFQTAVNAATDAFSKLDNSQSSGKKREVIEVDIDSDSSEDIAELANKRPRTGLIINEEEG